MILTEEEDIRKRWEEYITDLYKEGESEPKPIIKNETDGPEILPEVGAALKEMKKEKQQDQTA